MKTVIKRYQNRKLYDTNQSKYVTLKELERVVGQGREIQVIDQKDESDITTIVLLQIMLQSEKRKKLNSNASATTPELLHRTLRLI